MNKQVSDKCNETSMKIIDIIEGLGFTVEDKSKLYELRALITNEVRHCVSDVVVDFYKNTAIVTVEEEINEQTTNTNS